MFRSELFHVPKAGGKGSWPITSLQSTYSKRGLLSEAGDWECAADLQEWNTGYPEVIKRTGLRPDIVLHSKNAMEILLIELTVPYESRIDNSNEYKREKYSDLVKELKEAGYNAKKTRKTQPLKGKLQQTSSRWAAGSHAPVVARPPRVFGDKGRNTCLRGFLL